MPVNIHGKEYKTVAERLSEVSSDTKGKYSLLTEVLGDVNGTVLIKATLELERGTFVGHAYEREDAGYINKTSHVENCETSAIGRALAAAGYAGSEFASADEVANAITQQNEKKTGLSKQQIRDLIDAAGEVDDDTQQMIEKKIDDKSINSNNYSTSLNKLRDMKK
tara:strand:+ start:831 stop:1328 length:498 start_codon:yes stop_codon:yes gene_type:complete